MNVFIFEKKLNYSQIVKLITHIHLVLRSKNGWSCNSSPPICLHGIMLS